MAGLSIEDRRPGLDVVRCMAILLVMLHHFRSFKGCPEWLSWFSVRAYVGVDLFFVLSGWLIGSQLLRNQAREGRIGFGRFWVPRWARTIPSYLAMMALMLTLGKLKGGAVPWFSCFLQNYSGDVGAWLITWSLCVEEHFYLVLPIVVWILLRLNRPTLSTIVIIACMLAPPLLRWHAMGNAGFSKNYWRFLTDYYSVTHLRFEGLAMGVALAAVRQYRTGVWQALSNHASWLALAGLVLVVGATWSPWMSGSGLHGSLRMKPLPWVVGFWAVSLGTGLMIPLAHRWRGSAYMMKPVAFVSDHAYSLYLTHALVKEYVQVWCRGAPFWACFALAFSASILAAALLRYTVEVPVLHLRENLLRRAAPSREPERSLT